MVAAPTVEEALAARARRIERVMMSSSRGVYYVPSSGWVYKFDEPEDSDGFKPQEQNLVEWQVYMYLRENMHLLPKGTAIPEMVLLEEATVEGGYIIASRYVEVVNTIPDCERWDGLCDCFGDRDTCWWEMMEGDNAAVTINDLCGNVFYTGDKTYWLLDLGYGSDSV